MTPQPNDQELLQSFRDPATKERAFTAIIKKYQEKLYWHIRRMVVDHEDTNDVLQNMFIKFGMDWKISGRTVNYIPGFTGFPQMNSLLFWNNRKKDLQ